MENNNDPSTGSGTNKNKKVEELSDEQMKKVTGGGGIGLNCGTNLNSSCVKRDKDCNCTECAEGYVLRKHGVRMVCE